MIILDTESTGQKENQICQLAYIRYDGGTACAINEFYAVDSMNEYAAEVNGFSVAQLAQLSGGTRFKERAETISGQLSGHMLIGHNVSSDIKVLRDEFRRAGVPFSPARKFCTMNHFTHILNINQAKSRRPKYPSLNDLCEYLNVRTPDISGLCEELFNYRGRQHDARYDVCATLLCIQKAEQAGMIRGLLTKAV